MTKNWTKRKICIVIDGAGLTKECLRQHKEGLERIFIGKYGKTFDGISVDDRGIHGEKPITLLYVCGYIDIAHIGTVSFSQMKGWEKELRTLLNLGAEVNVDIVYDYEQYDDYEGQALIEQWHSEHGGCLSHTPGM